jgi:rRNA maturation protein Nop10
MGKYEILFNKKTNNYTLEKEIDGIKSEKRIPIKYKSEDSTSKYRKEILVKSL